MRLASTTSFSSTLVETPSSHRNYMYCHTLQVKAGLDAMEVAVESTLVHPKYLGQQSCLDSSRSYLSMSALVLTLSPPVAV